MVASELAAGLSRVPSDCAVAYQWLRVYGQSKLANIMFTYVLARRLAGSGVTANALHPGVVATRIYRSQNRLFNFAAMRVMPVFALSPEKGARTSVYLASAPEVASVSGQYFVKCKPKRSWKTSYDEATQERLWTVSEQLTGLG